MVKNRYKCDTITNDNLKLSINIIKNIKLLSQYSVWSNHEYF